MNRNADPQRGLTSIPGIAPPVVTDAPTAPDAPTSVADELNAMRRIVATLDKLDATASDRVVNWLYDRYRRDGDQ